MPKPVRVLQPMLAWGFFILPSTFKKELIKDNLNIHLFGMPDNKQHFERESPLCNANRCQKQCCTLREET
jgi:hypothetical protein